MIARETIMQSIQQLAPLSPTAPKLAVIVADPESNVDQIANVIQYDQALTLDVLKYANSVMSASSRKIATIKEAVVRLGGARILERVIGAHVKADMGASLDMYGYEENELWRHSVASAVAAELLCSVTRSSYAGLAFSASLLHDIGKLILSRIAPKNDLEQIGIAIRNDCACEPAEKKVLGYSHADVGGDIASSWGLPLAIVEAIRFHHSCEMTAISDEGKKVTDIVSFSNVVARSIGQGIGNEGMSLAIDPGLSKRLGISREQFEVICADSSLQLSIVLSMYEM